MKKKALHYYSCQFALQRKRVGSGTGAAINHRKRAYRKIHMHEKGLDPVQCNNKKKKHAQKNPEEVLKKKRKKKDLAVVLNCQLVLYSRRSLMIHYGADVSRVLVLRGI